MIGTACEIGKMYCMSVLANSQLCWKEIKCKFVLKYDWLQERQRAGGFLSNLGPICSSLQLLQLTSFIWAREQKMPLADQLCHCMTPRGFPLTTGEGNKSKSHSQPISCSSHHSLLRFWNLLGVLLLVGFLKSTYLSQGKKK